MSITVINGIRKLISPYILTQQIKQTGDDGLHLSCICQDGIHREFYTLEQAVAYANESLHARNTARATLTTN